MILSTATVLTGRDVGLVSQDTVLSVNVVTGKEKRKPQSEPVRRFDVDPIVRWLRSDTEQA